MDAIYYAFCGPLWSAQEPAEMVADPQKGWVPDFSFVGEPLPPLFDGAGSTDYECPLAKARWVHGFRVLRAYVSRCKRLPDQNTVRCGVNIGEWCERTQARAKAGMLSGDEMLVLGLLPYWNPRTRDWQKDGPFESAAR